MNNLFATNNPTEHINDFNAGTYNGGQTTEVQQNDKVNYLCPVLNKLTLYLSV